MRALLFALLALFVVPASAQQGAVLLTGWPPDDAAGRLHETDVLPYIDTLALDYAYGVEAGAPWLRFGIDWVAGPYGLVDGERRPADELPDSTFMVALQLVADVYVDGRSRAELVVRVDSMALRPRPDRFGFEVRGLAWGDIFEQTSARQAQQYFEDGFDLRNLRIESVAFASYDEAPAVAQADEERPPHVVVRRPRRPSRVGVYGGYPDVWVNVIYGGYSRPPRRPSGDRPRGERIGRDANEGEPDRHTPARGTTRGEAADPSPRDDASTGDGAEAGPTPPSTGRPVGRVAGGNDDASDTSTGSKRKKSRSTKDDDDDDDDDDDSKLGTSTALVAAAAIVGVAYVGGSVGVYAHEEAPLGLSAGFVRPGGGVLLHAGVNEDVLSEEREDPRLIAGVLGFRDVMQSPFQPLVGVGVLATDLEAEDLHLSFSLGMAANFRHALFFGAYDVARNSFGFGATFNFRSRARP